MTEKVAAFYSDGLKLDCSFYLPDSPSEPPTEYVIVVCSGFMGLKNIHPRRFAQQFTRLGYTCFGFDYRGFGKSEGCRGQVLIEEQIRDIVSAISYISTHPEVQARSIALLGWGMGAGLILEAARLCPPVEALISINGFYDAERLQVLVRGVDKWQEFQSWLIRERQELTRSGKSLAVDPFFIYPLDSVTEQYVDRVLRANPDFGGAVSLAFATSLLQFAPEKNLSHLRDKPILIAHGDRNDTHPAVEAESLYEKYPGPKTLYWVRDAGHTEWMFDDHPKFRSLVQYINAWLRDTNNRSRSVDVVNEGNCRLPRRSQN